MEAHDANKPLARKQSGFRILRKISGMRRLLERTPTRGSTDTPTKYGRMHGQGIDRNAVYGAQPEYLTYVTKDLLEAASKHSLVDLRDTNPPTNTKPTRPSYQKNTRASPANISTILRRSVARSPSSISERLSTPSASNWRSECSCRSGSDPASGTSSSASRRLSIYFLPPESLDLDELNTNYEGLMPGYISRSPISESDMEFFSLPPSSRSHEENEEIPTSCSTAVGQTEPSSELNKKSAYIESPTESTPVVLVKSSKLSAQKYLQLGIEAHENDDLKRSATLFHRSATETGGCGLGMLMWALSLRHGWGCEPDTERAYRWLRLAAETLVTDLNVLKAEIKHWDLLLAVDRSVELEVTDDYDKRISDLLKECKAVTSELLLALYELGQCLMRGWGCRIDKPLVSFPVHLP